MAISASILQNELKSRLPAEFVAKFPSGIEIAYAAIPVIHTLDEPLRTQVRVAFAESMAVVWKAMIGFSAAGFLTLFLLREVPMQKHTDETYGLQASGRASGEEEEGDAAKAKANATSVELTGMPSTLHTSGHPA